MIAGPPLRRNTNRAELVIFNKTMAYRLKLGETVPAGIRRVVHEEIEAAVRHLSGQGAASRDEAIHETRRSVKKIRGVLRLMQPELGGIYRLENVHFRDIGRQLSQFRDAGAMVETFDTLRPKYHGEVDGRTLARMRRHLMARKEHTEKQANIGEVLSGMAAVLLQSAARVSAWPLSVDGFPAIAPGLEATFRRAQKAMARARRHPRPENYHAWRKRVKEHWYHIRLLESLWTPGIRAYEKSLKDLETFLGEDHNLVVLHEKVLADPESYGKQAEIAQFVQPIGKYHEELRDRAFALGERLYDERPGHFTRRIHRLWDAWQARKTAARRRPSMRRSEMFVPPVTAGGNQIDGPSGLQGLPKGVPQ
jgi:CHAD domain-containing protein